MLNYSSRGALASCAILCVATTALLASSAPASAAEITKVRRVSYQDLDLTRAEGVRSLRWRVSAAVRHVCGADFRQPLLETHAQRACVQAASADAHAQMEGAVAAARATRTARR